MKKRDSLRKKWVSLMLCLGVLLAAALPAWADEETTDPEAAAAVQSIINDKELTAMVENFMAERGISKNNFSLGFCYTATGDTWYYNGDAWFYPASMYKVPLMMLLSEKVSSGELTQESMVEGMAISEIEELILTYSNNDWAHKIRAYLGGDAEWREEAKKYATLEEEEYDPDYLEYCYFNNRFMTEVMKTLYFNAERFPNLIDCLMDAQPKHYFRLSMEGQYDIAQKYGSFIDQLSNNFNHTTGIVYTQNPCIITVMTKNVDKYETVISDAAKMLTNYSLSLDKKLSAYQAELAAAAAEEQRKAEEAAAAEEMARAEKERQMAEAEAAQRAIQEQTARQEARIKLLLTLGIAAAVIVVIVIFINTMIKTKQRKKRDDRYDKYRRDYEAEQRAAQSMRGGYKPKH